MFKNEIFDKEVEALSANGMELDDFDKNNIRKSIENSLLKGGYSGESGTYDVDFEMIQQYNKAKTAQDRLRKYALGQNQTETEGGKNFNYGGSTSVSDLTSGGSKATNITINLRNLIEHFNLKTETFKEGVYKGTDELIEGLLRVVNSANRIATQ